MKTNKLIKLYYLIIFAFLISCSSIDNSIPKHIRDFVFDVTENPEKIRSINEYYPDLYDSNCYNFNMMDSKRTEELVEFIKYDFNDEKANYYMLGFNINDSELKKRKRNCPYVKMTDNYYQVSFKKKKYGLTFYFIKYDSVYKFDYIKKSIRSKR